MPLSYRRRSDMTPPGAFGARGLCEYMTLYISFWLCMIVSLATHWEICDVLKRKAMEDLKFLQELMGSQGPGDSQHDGAAVNRT